MGAVANNAVSGKIVKFHTSEYEMWFNVSHLTSHAFAVCRQDVAAS